ncbi:MAG: tetratricopeptide repeat protein [Parvibaculum sp.]|uniref:O-linked N-acetylglucosamine transferase, SPINDLY family protein n=1 Tax=Rhabdaerophilum calidifontis TaxID=2604328 RepID=UPI00140A9D21|nr:tetratricopeptide repeat protein [Rhabdaerophilum calidifontis]MCA1952064.1 tetratricopeptide repeat protein [Hyphomicrobiales bacterium]
MQSAVMFAKAVDAQLNGRPDEAKDLYKRLLRRHPDASEVLGNLAVLVKKDGQVAIAEQMLRRAVRANPQNFSALTTLANIRLAEKHWEEAKEFNDAALAIEPHYPDAIVNNGVLLVHDNKLDEAEQQFWRAMTLDPRNTTARMNFANVRRLKKMNVEESIEMLKSIVEKQPDNALVHQMLCSSYQETMKYVKALEHAYAAVEASKAASDDALNAVATTHVVLGELEEAMAYYEKSRAINPNNVVTGTAYLFTINYDDRKTSEDVFQEYRKHAKVISKNSKIYNHEKRAKIENRRIRLAYSSPDLYTHVVSFFIDPILRNHNRSRFELVAYANVIKPDEHTMYLRRYFDKWVDVTQMNDEEMAEQIYNDGIDIVVDLAGHTFGNRLSALSMKPAPIQATYLGFGYTTGLDEIDYFIGDKNFTPTGSEPYFSEKLLQIEAPVYAYNPPRHRTPDVCEPPAMRKGYVTFGTMTRMIRLNNRLLSVWKQILDRVPGSKLRFDQKTFEDPETIERFYRRLESLGYSRDRVELTSTLEHWNGYHEFDIALDCWPHNAGTTTFEALFSGVPVISKRDRVSVGRLSDMVLSPLGLGDWVVDTEEQFVEKAVQMASDIPALAEIRQKLRPMMENSPFFDFQGRTRALEAGYMEMVRRYNEQR